MGARIMRKMSLKAVNLDKLQIGPSQNSLRLLKRLVGQFSTPMACQEARLQVIARVRYSLPLAFQP